MSGEVIRRARGAVAALVLAGLVVAPWVVDDYTTALLARTLALALVGVSVALLTGVAGMPTLGQTAPYAAGAYACAVVGSRVSDVGVVQLVVAAGAGALLAALTVPLVVHARGVIVLMITLAIGELVVVVLGRWRSVTGGTDGLAGVPAVRPFWGLPALASDQGRYLYALVVVATLVGALLVLLRTRAGLVLRAGRDDEARLRASGHRVAVHLSGAHIAAGATAGAAGSLLVVAQQYISPADFGFDTSALLLLGVVIGGTASVGGALVGAALVIAVRDWLFGVLPGHAPLVLGALFVATVYLLPTGLNRARMRLSEAPAPQPDPPAAQERATVGELRR
ncbi:branched-chain amino acid ABC transporter permease [Micromonospora parva]|uniref:branched-chain amino acid ABC transporter permease n=1 Tax=Micromonospora parva TaxID=1464048 RepID=UPI0033C494E5